MPETESSLLEWLRARARAGREVEVGIGHDAAVVRTPRGDLLALKSDQTIEGVHFTRAEAPLALFGRKALARVLSDLGAVGARPFAALCSAALPADLGPGGARELLGGLHDLADEHGVSVVGGDLATSPAGIALDVCGVGIVESGSPMLRSGARPGDRLVVSGPLGGSRAGHHLRFEPRWREGVVLAARGVVHACIDLSDGLAIDLHRLARESGVGARVEAAALPLRVDAGVAVTVEQALADGEDYELLFAVAPADLARLHGLQGLDRVTLTPIGTVVPAAEGLRLERGDGRLEPLAAGGYEHRFGD